MLVSSIASVTDNTLILYPLDFMSVRKIPLKKSPLIADGSEMPSSSEDPDVGSFITKIRETALTDRAVHDLVTPQILC